MIGKRQGFYMYICSREDRLAVTILEKIMRPSEFEAFFILFYFWQFFNQNCHLFTSDPASLLGLRSIQSRRSRQIIKWRKDEVYYIICNTLHNLCNHPQCFFFSSKSDWGAVTCVLCHARNYFYIRDAQNVCALNCTHCSDLFMVDPRGGSFGTSGWSMPELNAK